MRGVMLNLRERRRAGARAEVGELHELLHGVRIEQQRTQRCSQPASSSAVRHAARHSRTSSSGLTFVPCAAWSDVWGARAAALASTEAREHQLGAASSANAAARARRRLRARPSPAAAGHLAPRDNARIPAHCGAPREHHRLPRLAHGSDSMMLLARRTSCTSWKWRKNWRRSPDARGAASSAVCAWLSGCFHAPTAGDACRWLSARTTRVERGRGAAARARAAARGLAATVSAHGAAHRDAADAARAATEAALAAESERWRVGAEESARRSPPNQHRDGELAAGRAELERLRADGAVREQALELALQTQRDDALREAAAAEAVTGRGGARRVADALGAKAARQQERRHHRRTCSQLTPKDSPQGLDFEAADPEAEIPEGLRARATRAHSADQNRGGDARRRGVRCGHPMRLRRWWPKPSRRGTRPWWRSFLLAHESETRSRRRVAAVGRPRIRCRANARGGGAARGGGGARRGKRASARGAPVDRRR